MKINLVKHIFFNYLVLYNLLNFLNFSILIIKLSHTLSFMKVVIFIVVVKLEDHLLYQLSHLYLFLIIFFIAAKQIQAMPTPMQVNLYLLNRNIMVIAKVYHL